MSGAGSPNVSTTTSFPGGTYSLSGFGAGSYTVTPTKTGGGNGAVGSFDAARVAQHAAGPPNPQLNANQLIAADVSNNGSVSSFDAGMIAKFVAGMPYLPPGIGLTGTWRFIPANRPYPSITSSIAGQDYSAVLMGEVSGNWTNSGARPTNEGNGPERSISVQAPQLAVLAGEQIIIPLSVEAVSNKGIISYEFDLRYDPSVLQPLENPVDVAGTVSRGLSIVTNTEEPGLLRVVIYGPMPIDADGSLVNLRFTAVGTPGAQSPLIWERIIFNEGEPRVIATEGQVVISF